MSCADACTLACLLPVDTFLLEQLVAIIKLLTTCVFLFQFEFEGEEGTGLGPTLEFYSLVAAALQEKSLGMFLCDDDTHDHVGQEVNFTSKCCYVNHQGLTQPKYIQPRNLYSIS